MNFIATLTFLSLSLSTPAAAGTQYRCNGMVQYRPCGQEIATGRTTRSKTAAAPSLRTDVPRYDVSPRAFSKNTGAYAEVLNQSMSPIGASTAQWRGSLRGNGSIRLQLLWYRDGVLSMTRSMGVVKLVHKTTSFAFRTSVPRGPGWSWKVAALASPLS
ncbi:MAG: hypothetical protein J0M12_05930 [Deltaproteobacteria bacterium]|nr:hypothetical protein [Deltaproteobacteria bacterium]